MNEINRTETPAQPSAPATTSGPVLAYAGTAPLYQSGRTLAVASMVLLGLGVFAAVVSAGLMYMQVNLLQRIEAGQPVSPAEAAANDRRVQVTAIAELTLIVVTAVVFLMWLYRVTKNLRVFSRDRPRFTPGWAVGYFFIPILNLFRPYQALTDAWNRSVPGPGGAWPETQRGVITLWWACWLLSGFIARFGQRLASGDATLPGMITGTWAQIAADITTVFAGIACIIMVNTIDRMQAAKALEPDPEGQPDTVAPPVATLWNSPAAATAPPAPAPPDAS